MLNAVRKNNRGLTLVELLLGVTILGIIIVPLLHIFITGTGTAAKSRRYGEATSAAQNLTEQIQALGADKVLGNAQSVAGGAGFYTYNGSLFTAVGTGAPAMPDTLPKTYYIGVPNYTYGSAAFDALITLDVSNDADNSKEVVVANQIEAALDMRKADDEAVLALKAECGDMMDNVDELTADNLNRSISVNVIKTVDAAADTYRIEVLFEYSGLIQLTAEEEQGKTYSFSYGKQSSSVVALVPDSVDGAPVFSVYLFYKAYYKNGLTNENLIINNTTGSDVNFFIVNTGTAPAPLGSKSLIWYRNQAFNGSDPVNKLIYTNLDPSAVTYRASKDALFRKTLSVTGYLVQTEARDRKYSVSVKLFPTGSGFTGTPIAVLDSTKLSY